MALNNDTWKAVKQRWMTTSWNCSLVTVELLQPHLSGITFVMWDSPSDYDVTYFALVLTGEVRSNQLQNQIAQQNKKNRQYSYMRWRGTPVWSGFEFQYLRAVERGVVMMHLSQAHDTRRRLDAVKCFVFPVIFVVSVHQVARHVEDQGSEGDAGKQGFCFRHSPSL